MPRVYARRRETPLDIATLGLDVATFLQFATPRVNFATFTANVAMPIGVGVAKSGLNVATFLVDVAKSGLNVSKSSAGVAKLPLDVATFGLDIANCGTGALAGRSNVANWPEFAT